jgi:hypothetical protein
MESGPDRWKLPKVEQDSGMSMRRRRGSNRHVRREFGLLVGVIVALVVVVFIAIGVFLRAAG